jgi:hypothetical protein
MIYLIAAICNKCFAGNQYYGTLLSGFGALCLY